MVKRIQSIVAERSAAGDEIIIVGDRNHDEVLGAASYGKNVRVVSDSEELEFSDNPTCVVFQTTILADKFGQISRIAEIRKKRRKTVGIFTLLLYYFKPTRRRRASSRATHDVVIVLGSRTSANTRRLFEVASAVNPRTYFAQSAAELPLERSNIRKAYQSWREHPLRRG